MRAPLLLLLFSMSFFAGCKKETQELQTEPLSDYLPAQPAKYITYRTDSTLFTNFGTTTTVRSYQEKHQVDAQLTDNEGKPAYWVFRSLRNATGSDAWRPAGTYTITPGTAAVEVVENNLRFLRLAAPIRQDHAWKGNRHLPFEPFGAAYNFSNDDNMADWEFSYTKVGENLSLNNRTYANVITVTEVDDDLLLDTITVADNKAVVASLKKSKGIWIRGQATSDIAIVIPNQPAGTTLTVYNRTNRAVVLNGISTPPGAGRNLEYVNNNWRFGNNEDKLTYETPYGSINYSVKKYAKGIGLIYEEFIMWEYQPNPGGTGYRTGFGVKRSVIDHN